MADQLDTMFRELADSPEPVGLRSATDVRRRGDHRRRSQRAGAVVAVAILAAGVASVAGSVAERSQEAPPTTSPGPTAVSHPLLPASSFAPIGPYDGFEKADAVGLGVLSLSCLGAPGAWGASQMWTQYSFSPLDATFSEAVLQFPDEASATAAAARPLADFAVCPEGDPADATVADRSEQLDVGDQSYRLARSTTPTGGFDLGYNEVAVARIGSVVIVLDWRSQGSPVEAPGWAWTADQIQAALDRATGADPLSR